VQLLQQGRLNASGSAVQAPAAAGASTLDARAFVHSPRSIPCGIFAGYSPFESRFNQAIRSELVP
jgi:hypothetical protein